jgi:hypothetical protein
VRTAVCGHGHGFLALGRSFQLQHDWIRASSVFHPKRNHAREPKLKKLVLECSSGSQLDCYHCAISSAT